MVRVNFRTIQDRFTHIDGEVVSAKAYFGRAGEWEREATADVVVRFYAWWEHPLYLAARDAGAKWGFDSDASADREITIHAIEPLKCELSHVDTAIDLAFLTEHPSLWEFEEEASIICNSDFEHRELLERLMSRNIPHLDQATLLRYVPPYPRFRAPYSLGYFPFTLFGHITIELDRMGVKTYLARNPKAPPSMAALMIDGRVVIVAKDFDLEVPQFEHRPEWFRPSE